GGANRPERHTLCFASKTDSMLQMLRESNEVLEKFRFGSPIAFPDSWLSKYRRYLVGESEVVVSRIRSAQVLSKEDLQDGEWCAAFGLGRELDVLRITPRLVAGMDTTEISFRRKGLWGTRVCVPVANQWFVFQLLSPEEDYGTERGRLEGVLSTARFTQSLGRLPAIRTIEPERNEDDGSTESDADLKREALPWTESPRARARLEMRLMLYALTHNERKFDLNPTAWFMEHNCSWVVSKLLGADKVTTAMAEQQDVFDRAFHQLVSELDSEGRAALLRRLARVTSLPKVTIERVISRPGERMYIATLARVAVALSCPLFGFDTLILDPEDRRISELPEEP
ncbi:MAG: hypothetical protein ACPG4T_16475, partial [Nannocystaceae bacterium]